MSNDLISRNAVIKAINNLMESPYANSLQFGKERKEVMETVKAVCIRDIPAACDLESVIEQIENIMKDENIRFCDQAVRMAVNILKSAINATNGKNGGLENERND